MNDPTHPVAAPPSYDEDVYGWAVAQAALIRAGRIDKVDWAQVAEELEDMGKSEYRALESALRVLLLHLLKWDKQVAFRSRSWMHSVAEHGRRYRRLLDQNPSLKPHLEEIRRDAYISARTEAVSETGLPIETFPIDPPGWNIINNPPVHEDDIPSR